MNQTIPSNTPCYDLITKAATTLESELSFFSDHMLPPPDKDEHILNNKPKIEEIEREIVFLRSCIEYFYANKVYPFALPCATEDYCNDYTPEGVDMTPEEYLEENKRLWNKYRVRVLKICKKFEALGPLDQKAFELGNKIWGTVSLHMVQKASEEDDEPMVPAAEACPSNCGCEDDDISMVPAETCPSNCGCEELDEGGILGKCRFLKSAFKFVEPKDVAVKKPMDDEDRKKTLQIEELQFFLLKINAVRMQALTLLDEYQS